MGDFTQTQGFQFHLYADYSQSSSYLSPEVQQSTRHLYPTVS